jgi:integrase
LDAFLGSRARSVRYDYRIRLAATEFGKWLEGRSEGDAIQAVTKRTAAHFLDHVRQRLADHSLKGWKSGLSLYWDWMMDREEVALNPWKELKPEKRPQVAKPHAFSDAELLALLKGDPGQPLADLIRVGALSGMRLNEIGRLKVKDTEGGWFNVTAAKTSAGVRRVPIHPDLAGIVARRTEGREPETWLFDDLPASAGKGRQRAYKAGERFTLYRRSLGVGADHGEGRSPVSFHSLRHWFDTAALNAGTMPVVVSALMGHSEGQSMTRGTYYAGPTAQLMIDAVAAVRLPPAGTSICGSVTA